MNKFGMAAGSSIMAVLPLAATADSHVVMQPDALKWVVAPASLPKGAQVAVLVGDPNKGGPYVIRVKLPAGYKMPSHTQPTDENVTVISGALHIGHGDTFDQAQGEAQGEAVKAGGYVFVPKGEPHYTWVTEETVIQLSGTGPLVMISYINPAEDARKTN